MNKNGLEDQLAEPAACCRRLPLCDRRAAFFLLPACLSGRATPSSSQHGRGPAQKQPLRAPPRPRQPASSESAPLLAPASFVFSFYSAASFAPCCSTQQQARPPQHQSSGRRRRHRHRRGRRSSCARSACVAARPEHRAVSAPPPPPRQRGRPLTTGPAPLPALCSLLLLLLLKRHASGSTLNHLVMIHFSPAFTAATAEKDAPSRRRGRQRM